LLGEGETVWYENRRPVKWMRFTMGVALVAYVLLGALLYYLFAYLTWDPLGLGVSVVLAGTTVVMFAYSRLSASKWLPTSVGCSPVGVHLRFEGRESLFLAWDRISRVTLERHRSRETLALLRGARGEKLDYVITDTAAEALDRAFKESRR
jgi:hypothetical protein